jgi:hypothetical protein
LCRHQPDISQDQSGRRRTLFEGVRRSDTRLIKKDNALVEQVIKKWHRESDAGFIKKTAEVYAKIFKPIPYVSDQGLDIVVKEIAGRRPVAKEFFGRPELFRDHAPLEKLVKEGLTERGS